MDSPFYGLADSNNKLYNTQQELVQAISVEHTRELFGGNLGILFYDVTTLYFETTDKDELRESGFSKDGKNSNPQVVLGLLVSRGGYPLSYSLFNGSQYEGYTMIPIVDDFVQRFKLGKDFVVIADAGLMSSKNIKLLRDGGYMRNPDHGRPANPFKIPLKRYSFTH